MSICFNWYISIRPIRFSHFISFLFFQFFFFVPYKIRIWSILYILLFGFNLNNILPVKIHLIINKFVFFMQLSCWNNIIIIFISKWLVSSLVCLGQGFLLGGENCFFHWLWLITSFVRLVLSGKIFFYVPKVYFLKLVIISIETLKFLHVTYIIRLLSWKSWRSSFY
jgi:hypothetical protein